MSRPALRSLAYVACMAGALACEGADTRTASGAIETPARPRAEHGGARAAKLSDKCDGAKLTGLIDALAAAKPGEGPELVAKQLGEACELPAAVSSFFAASTPKSGEPDLETLGKAAVLARDVLIEVCPKAAEVRKELAEAPGAQRTALLFERCDFQRFELIDKDAWVRGDPSSPVPFVAYQWLVQQGLAPADAKSISRMMLLRDRKQWERGGQELPLVAQRLAPVPEGVAIYIGLTQIAVNGQKLVSLVDGDVDADALQGHLIGPLFDVLAEEAEKGKQIAAAVSEDWPATAVLVVDASTTQEVLVDVLYSAGRAEFRTYALVALSAPYEYGALLVEPPKFLARPDPETPSEFVVAIAADGFRVRGSRSFDAPTHIPLNAGGTPDFAALTAAAEAHKTANPTATVARVQAENSTLFGVVAQTFATLNGSECRTGKASCLLPTLVIEASGGSSSDPEKAARDAGILGMLGAEGGGFAVGKGDDPWEGLTGQEVGEAFGVSGLGLVGTGQAGCGVAEGASEHGDTGLSGKSSEASRDGTGLGGRGKTVPRVRQGKATVRGSLDKDIIRRIARTHINEVRHCYGEGLQKDPTLAGDVTIDFTIAATGKVSASSVAKDGLGDDEVAGCVAKAIKRWTFPKPAGGGTVKVAYPFELEPG